MFAAIGLTAWITAIALCALRLAYGFTYQMVLLPIRNRLDDNPLA